MSATSFFVPAGKMCSEMCSEYDYFSLAINSFR